MTQKLAFQGWCRVRTIQRLLVLIVLAGTASCVESKAAGNSIGAKGTATEACGDKDQPDCPLQQWMKATVRSYLNAKDSQRLGAAFDLLAEKSPEGYEGWREMSLTAASAARSGDFAKAKLECKRCHDQHRERFRKEHRTIALF